MGKQTGIGLSIGVGAVILIASSGCAGLKLQTVDHSVHRPSNVAVYFTVIVILVNLLVDLAYAALDPRVRVT